MTDLRRLAEQPGGLFIFKDKEEGGYELDVRQAILALLASRDMWADRANDYHRKRNAAERRVAALEELVLAAEVYISQVSVHADGTVGSGYIIEPESEASDE